MGGLLWPALLKWVERDGDYIKTLLLLFYFILSRLLYLAFSANLGLLCMPNPGMGPLV